VNYLSLSHRNFDLKEVTRKEKQEYWVNDM
jgi:hypothetical protein